MLQRKDSEAEDIDDEPDSVSSTYSDTAEELDIVWQYMGAMGCASLAVRTWE